MTDDEKAKKALLLHLFSGYPQLADRITADTLDTYMAAIAECSLESVGAAVHALAAGKVEGRNGAFMPSSAEVAIEARRVERDADVQAWIERTMFVEEGSPEWRALLQTSRPHGMPSASKTMANGVKVEGWWVPKEEVARLPKAIVKSERRMLARGPDPRVAKLLAAVTLGKKVDGPDDAT